MTPPTITVSGRTYRLSRDGYGHLLIGGYDPAVWPEAVRVAAFEAAAKGKV
jgi:hypothetical protein